MNKSNLVSVYIPKSHESLFEQAKLLAEARGISLGKLMLTLVAQELERENKTPHVTERIGGYVIKRGKLYMKEDGSWSPREDEAKMWDESHMAYEVLDVVSENQG